MYDEAKGEDEQGVVIGRTRYDRSHFAHSVPISRPNTKPGGPPWDLLE